VRNINDLIEEVRLEEALTPRQQGKLLRVARLRRKKAVTLDRLATKQYRTVQKVKDNIEGKGIYDYVVSKRIADRQLRLRKRADNELQKFGRTLKRVKANTMRYR